MSQFKFNIADAQYPLDAFATVTVASTVGYIVGEKVTAGAVTADVSRIVSSTRLVVDGVKGGITMSGNLVGDVSTTTSAISAFAWGQPRMRDVDGVMTEKMFGVITGVDDRGVLFKTREDDHVEVSVSCRQALSKIQNTDASVAPTLAYVLPADGTYTEGMLLRFIITSNEALSVVGSPQITTGDSSTNAIIAAYNDAESTSMKLVFDYVVGEVDGIALVAGQIDAAVYAANGAVVTDIGGSAVTPVWSGATTGILLG